VQRHLAGDEDVTIANRTGAQENKTARRRSGRAVEFFSLKNQRQRGASTMTT
jgi:hypothetical protein